MELNIIILGLLVVLLGLTIYSVVKHKSCKDDFVMSKGNEVPKNLSRGDPSDTIIGTQRQ